LEEDQRKTEHAYVIIKEEEERQRRIAEDLFSYDVSKQEELSSQAFAIASEEEEKKRRISNPITTEQINSLKKLAHDVVASMGTKGQEMPPRVNHNNKQHLEWIPKAPEAPREYKIKETAHIPLTKGPKGRSKSTGSVVPLREAIKARPQKIISKPVTPLRVSASQPLVSPLVVDTAPTVVSTLPTAVKTAPTIVDTVVDTPSATIVKTVPTIVEAAPKVVGTVPATFVKTAPTIIDTAPTVVDTAAATYVKTAPTVVETVPTVMEPVPMVTQKLAPTEERKDVVDKMSREIFEKIAAKVLHENRR